MLLYYANSIIVSNASNAWRLELRMEEGRLYRSEEQAFGASLPPYLEYILLLF